MMNLDVATKKVLRANRDELLSILVRLNDSGDVQRKLVTEKMKTLAQDFLSGAREVEFEGEPIKIHWSELIPEMAASLAIDILQSLMTGILEDIDEGLS